LGQFSNLKRRRLVTKKINSIFAALKGGHIDLNNENNELESKELLENAAEAQDATADENQSTETADSKAEVENPKTEENAEATPEVAAEASTEDAEQEAETSAPIQVQADDNPVHDPDAFDWTIDKEGVGTYDEGDKKGLEDLYKKTFNQIEELSLATGKIVSMTDKDVIIDIGFKSDGLVGRTEFKNEDIEVGQEVEVWIEQIEDEKGQLILSRKKALAETAWDKITKAYEDGSILNGQVKSRTKGGLVVDLIGMDAFLPGSQIDVKPIRDYDQYVGQKMEFKVVKINEVFKNVVISHKALIEDDIEAQKGEILARLEKGQVLEGVVKNMTSFGVFIDLGGLDGLLHITDVSWGRINHPEEVLELDQKINVVVLDFDDDKKRISLGLKQLTPHPWDNLSEELEVGAKVKGKVVTLADYGAFVELENGIEGLIHVSEMSWSQHLRNPTDFMKVGDEVDAVVLSIDKEEHKLSLGIKQLTPDPWENIESKYPVDSKHKGIVRNLTNYGLFVELEEGVDGLVHVSDLSWSKKIKHPAEFTNKGEELEVVVLEIDRDNRRLSLGHKQLDENPWDTFESIFLEGSEHKGTVVEVQDKGTTVAMPYGVEAFAPNKHIKKQDKTTVKPDEELDFRVIEFNKDQKRIIVSHTDIWKDEEREKADVDRVETNKRVKKTANLVTKINKKKEVSTLGELGGLAELKAKMEAQGTEEKKEEKPKAKKAEAKEEKKETAPKTEGADDLKALPGVGPALAKKLNEAGYTSFSQIAGLDADGITALEEAIAKSGIVEKNDWITKAKELAG
jgi:small subunit ribosomal protein S1